MAKRIGAIIIFLSVLGPAGVSHADINDSLQRMFDGWGGATQTRPGAYQSQVSGALTGGSMGIRIPNETFNLVNFAPPRFSAGCGKIDLYLGSISFPSLSRFTDLLQQLGTSAVLGFAFQLALMELCQPCENIISKLEAAARAINAAGRISPCQIGGELAKLARGQPNQISSVATKIQDSVKEVGVAGGALMDYWAGQDAERTQTTRQAAAALDGTPEDPKGNLVYQALIESGWAVDDAKMMQSVMGTVYVGADGVPAQLPPTIRLSDLINADGTTMVLRLLDCGPTDTARCLAPFETDVTNLVGTQLRAERMYDTIVQKLTVDGIALTPVERDLIDKSPIPLYRLLVGYSTKPGQTEVLKAQIGALLGAQFAWGWIDRALKEIEKQSARWAQKQVGFPADVNEFYKQAYTVRSAAHGEVMYELERLGHGPAFTFYSTQTLKKALARPERKKNNVQ
jgi:conjugative transfer pilus assembly protein TraH